MDGAKGILFRSRPMVIGIDTQFSCAFGRPGILGVSVFIAGDPSFGGNNITMRIFTISIACLGCRLPAARLKINTRNGFPVRASADI